MSNTLILIIVIFFVVIIAKLALSKKNEDQKTDKNKSSDLDIVSKANFSKQKLLNNEEIVIYSALIKKIIIPNKGKYRLFAQVNLGEILKCNGPAFWKINTKRVDFCITTMDFEPIAVIEYHGTGHKGNKHELRDAVKQIATEKAGLIYFAIDANELKSIDEPIERFLEKLTNES